VAFFITAPQISVHYMSNSGKIYIMSRKPGKISNQSTTLQMKDCGNICVMKIVLITTLKSTYQLFGLCTTILL